MFGRAGGLYNVVFGDGTINMWVNAKLGLHNTSWQLTEIKPAATDMRMVPPP